MAINIWHLPFLIIYTYKIWNILKWKVKININFVILYQNDDFEYHQNTHGPAPSISDTWKEDYRKSNDGNCKISNTVNPLINTAEEARELSS